MISPYLKKLGLKEGDLPWHLPIDAKKSYHKQVATNGFSDNELWNLDYTIALLVYPRLKRYKEKSPINLSLSTVEFDGKTMTLDEAIDIVLVNFEEYIRDDTSTTVDEIVERAEEQRKAFQLFGIIIPYLWW